MKQAVKITVGLLILVSPLGLFLFIAYGMMWVVNSLTKPTK